MTRNDSETTSTDARARMVERQLRRRGIEDERVLAAMGEVPRERFVPADQRAARLPRRRAADRRGPDDLAALDRRLHGPAARAARATSACSRSGTGSGYAAAVLSRLCARGGDDRALREPRRGRPQRRSPSSATTTSRCATGDGTPGAPDRAPFGGISVTATAAGRAAAGAARAAGAGRRARLPGGARAPRAAGALPRRRARRPSRPCASCRS